MRPYPADSSDLGLAGAFSRHLASRQAALEPEPAPLVAFPRFAPPPSAVRDSRATERDSRIADAALVPLDLESWEAFLAWSLELSRARAAFVVDSQGFVIGSRGSAPSGDFTGTGAELCYTMDQMASFDHASGKLHALELEFEGYRLIGLRIAPEGGADSFILGLVGSRPLGEELRRGIVRQLLYSLPNLS